MKTHLLFILLMPLAVRGLCSSSYIEVGERCLYFGTEHKMEYIEAHEYCNEMPNGKLAAVTSARQFKAMVDFIYEQGLDLGNYWLDGSDQITEGNWITFAGESIPMGTPFWAGYPDHQEPNNQDVENCLQLNDAANYYLNDAKCEDQYMPLCEEKDSYGSKALDIKESSMENSPCPAHSVEIGGKCLSFHTWESQTWPEARIICSDNDGDLAIIDDIELLRAVYLYILEEKLENYSFWLGGSDKDEEGVWKWVDGSPVPMGTPFWGMLSDNAQEPNGGTDENYLVLLQVGYHYFRDISNTEAHYPLCEIPPQQK